MSSGKEGGVGVGLSCVTDSIVHKQSDLTGTDKPLRTLLWPGYACKEYLIRLLRGINATRLKDQRPEAITGGTTWSAEAEV